MTSRIQKLQHDFSTTNGSPNSPERKVMLEENNSNNLTNLSPQEQYYRQRLNIESQGIENQVQQKMQADPHFKLSKGKAPYQHHSKKERLHLLSARMHANRHQKELKRIAQNKAEKAARLQTRQKFGGMKCARSLMG